MERRCGCSCAARRRGLVVVPLQRPRPRPLVSLAAAAAIATVLLLLQLLQPHQASCRWFAHGIVLRRIPSTATARTNACLSGSSSSRPEKSCPVVGASTRTFSMFRRATWSSRTRRLQPLLLSFGNNNNDDNNNSNKNPFSFLINPYNSKIPKEIENEIYQAEGNTSAAKDRTVRVGLYAALAILGVGMAFFNAFLSELRSSPTPPADLELPPFALETSPFAWVQDYGIVTQFLFLNKLGGLCSLLLGAGAGLLAEAELDTRRINAEKIYQEWLRRRAEKEKQLQRSRGNNNNTGVPQKTKKKKRLGTRESKRMGALAEVALVDDDDDDDDDDESNPSQNATRQETTSTATIKQPTTTTTTAAAATTTTTTTTEAETTKSGGMLDSLQEFYNRADSMAAQQALLLNKKLEDAGVLEKITDETGMRVVGKQQPETTATATNTNQKDDNDDDDAIGEATEISIDKPSIPAASDVEDSKNDKRRTKKKTKNKKKQ